MNLWDKDEIVKIIREEDLFMVSSHVGPDGDNVGSSCALVAFLKNLGKEAYYVMDEALPVNLSYLWEENGVLTSEEAHSLIGERAYTSVFLDCGDEDRLCCDKSFLQNPHYVVIIDHHETNEGYGTHNLIAKKASSTCQVVFELLEVVDENSISPFVATSLYTGLITDSGNFKFSSANHTTLEVAGKLLRKNADKELIMTKLYRNQPLGMIKLTAKVLSTLEKTDNIAIMHMTKQMREETDTDYNDTDSLADYAIDIDGVEIGCFVKEKDANFIKISFRAKNKRYNVAELAKEFGGGGHILAAGCTLQTSVTEARTLIKSKIEEYIKNV